jgi:hypothetical protein
MMGESIFVLDYQDEKHVWHFHMATQSPEYARIESARMREMFPDARRRIREFVANGIEIPVR